MKFTSPVIAGIISCLFWLLVSYIVYLTWFAYEAPLKVSYSHPVAVAHTAKSRAELVDLESVAPGHVFYTYREYCIAANYHVLRTERWLISEDGDKTKDVAFPLVPSRVQRGIGACEKRTFDVEVPKQTRPGKYKFIAEWSYTIDGNPIATYLWVWPEVRVEVR